MKERLFNIAPNMADGNPVVRSGVINAPQSALTFAGAPTVVTVVVKVLGVINPAWGDSKLLLVALSLLVGMLIYWNSNSTAQTFKEKFLSFMFALLNSFAISAATLGINAAT